MSKLISTGIPELDNTVNDLNYPEKFKQIIKKLLKTKINRELQVEPFKKNSLQKNLRDRLQTNAGTWMQIIENNVNENIQNFWVTIPDNTKKDFLPHGFINLKEENIPVGDIIKIADKSIKSWEIRIGNIVGLFIPYSKKIKDKKSQPPMAAIDTIRKMIALKKVDNFYHLKIMGDIEYVTINDVTGIMMWRKWMDKNEKRSKSFEQTQKALKADGNISRDRQVFFNFITGNTKAHYVFDDKSNHVATFSYANSWYPGLMPLNDHTDLYPSFLEEIRIKLSLLERMRNSKENDLIQELKNLLTPSELDSFTFRTKLVKEYFKQCLR